MSSSGSNRTHGELKRDKPGNRPAGSHTGSNRTHGELKLGGMLELQEEHLDLIALMEN